MSKNKICSGTQVSHPFAVFLVLSITVMKIRLLVINFSVLPTFECSVVSSDFLNLFVLLKFIVGGYSRGKNRVPLL
jgi:hypothetical protein